jgi:amino acid transporter
VDTALAAVIGLIGGVFLVFGPSMARARTSFHYSYEELHNPSNPRHRRVQLATIAGAALSALVGAAFLYFSIHVLVDGVLAPAAAITAGVGTAVLLEYRNRRRSDPPPARRRARSRRWRKSSDRSSADGW